MADIASNDDDTSQVIITKTDFTVTRRSGHGR